MSRCRVWILTATDQALERDRLTGNFDGLPYNWDGKYYLWYRLTMLTLFEEHGLTDVLYKRVCASQLSTVEGLRRHKYTETNIKRMIGTTLPTNKLHHLYECQTGSNVWASVEGVYMKKSSKG